METTFDTITFNLPKKKSNSIKVIGVGGGGSNAVNYMFQQNIKGVDFVICNTDAQALENSPVPNKIQLGVDLTSGLGAGANPEIGAQSANESIKEIQQMLNTQTKMVFITAGMGGGTGTGAAPIIAKIAKDIDILTVGIVTIPFQFEGKRRLKQAQEGICILRKNVDSLIIINNNKLREVYGNLGFKSGFSKADEVLSTAAKGIAEVITHHYKQNIDLRDAKTVLSNSGTAIMGSAKESGTGRAKNAIVKALDSPLLNDNRITGAKNVLLLIVSGANEVTLDEIGEINDYIQAEAGYDTNIIMGVGEDQTLEEAISVTVVATGFATDQQSEITNTEVKKIFHTLEDEQKATYDFSEKTILKTPNLEDSSEQKTTQKSIHSSEEQTEKLISTTKNKDIEDNEILTTLEQEFIITPVDKKTNQIEQPKQLQTNLIFNLPSENNQKINIEQENLEMTNQIQPTKQTSEIIKDDKNTEKKYVLEDFDAQPTIKKSSIPTSAFKNNQDPFEFKVKTKTQKSIDETQNTSEQISPLSLTISELKKKSQERRQKMKGFNYKFKEQVIKNIEDIEGQPAYKRKGVYLDEINTEISKSRTSLSTDSNGQDQLRSNNSFLHDNVD